jgi:hypothetical protein
MIVLILVLVFLFVGEPDLWDNLHEWAMHKTTVNKDCKDWPPMEEL